MMKQTWNFPNKNNNNKKVIYCNARIIDPESNLDIKGELITIGNKIADFGANLFDGKYPDDAEIIDCNGNILAPGLIDIQVHFREPGQTHKESIATGSKSAAAGGITTVVCQPNTNPVIDAVEIIQLVKARAKETSYINIETYACITRGMKGLELTDMGKLVEAGAVGFTDDGLPVMNALLMRRAFSYASMFNVPIVQHAEDLNLSQGGCINEGPVSFKLGVTGIPNISESVIVERDIAILELTGGKYHVLHVSTKEALESIRRGKAKGLNITAEAAPHHFALTDEAVLGFNSYAKMNPPLRAEQDRQAIIQGLIDGTIDAIATDHAPHDEASKQLPLAEASFGIVGVETMLPISLELYHNKAMSLIDVIGKMTNQAAKIINNQAGIIRKGATADLVIINLDLEWTIAIEKFAGKSNNSPFDGRKVKGRALRTIVGGETVYLYS
jgi:dihydroorotase